MKTLSRSIVGSPSQRLQRFALTLAAACVMSVAALHAPPALAAPGDMVALPDFTAIVEHADPAVVNIRTTATVPSRRSMQGRSGAPGSDPYELFRFFFGPDAQIPGPGGAPDAGPRGQAPSEGSRTVPRGLGSGFFLTQDGYILTNNHVVADAADIIVTLTDGREFKAKLIGTDERTDVALLKIDATGMTTLPIGDPSKLRKGNWVLAIGSPFGLDSTVTSGIVSAIGRDTGEYLPFIQTDVAVNPGNSGGPLLNMKGEVVGINSQIVSRSGGFMGISLAIPIDEAMRVQEQLRTKGRVTRGLIGVQIGEVSQEVASAIGLPKAQGALVSGVQAGGPSEAAGVQPGDVILKFDNQDINRWSDLPRIVGGTAPGASGKLEVWRKGKRLTLDVKVAELKTGSTPDDAPAEAAPGVTNALGLDVTEVPAEVQRKLRIKGGVLVRSVTGASDNAGIAEGDIILAVNQTDVTGVAQFNKLAAGLEKGRSAGVLVRRGDVTLWVAVQLTK